VAVLGCGIDRDYPAAHVELACRIGESGLVVSEYEPGIEPAPWRFPARNRIIAGICRATLVVEARDSSGVVISDPVVSWTTTDALVASVDAAGLVTAVGLGAATIEATVDGTTGKSAVDVADVPPLARTWIGGDLAGPGDWTNPANWSPAGTPRVADTVLVPAAPWAPTLWVNATVAAVSVDGGASLQVDGTLTVTGSVSGALGGAGTVHLAGDGSVAGTVPSLHVTGTALAGADLQVAGDLVVDAGGTLVVTSGEVRVEGLALFAGENVEGTLTGGTLSLGGDFVAKGSDAFRPDAGFLVVFRGAKAPQTASMDAPGSAGQRFADVVVANATAEGVRFEGVAIGGALRDDGVQPARMRFDGAPSRVDGAVSLALAGSIAGAGTLTVLGELDAPSSTVSVAVLRLAGAKGTTTLGALADGHALLEMIGADQPLRSGLAYRDVRVAGRAYLLGPEPVTFDGSLTIEGDAAELAPQGTPLVVTGDLATAKLGVLAMRDDADDVTVKGSVTIDGGPTAEALVFGTLRVGGHFTVLCKTAECFQPSENGNLVVELDGVEAQEVALALPGAPGTGNDLQRFRHIRVANAKGVTFATGAAVRGDLVVVAGAHATIPEGIWVDVHGTLDVDTSGSDPGWIDNYGELYAGDDKSSGQVKPNQVLPRK